MVNNNMQPSASTFCQKKSVYKWPKSSLKWKNATTKLIKIIIKDRRLVNLVEGQGFHNFLIEVVPEYEVPCFDTITTYMVKICEQEKTAVEMNLPKAEFAAMTMDGGSATNGSTFQDTNVHIITDDMEL